jgi:hypothetical protein
VTLATQPLFRVLAAIIVLLITDYRPVWGLVAGTLWVLWILMPHYVKKNRGGS